VDDGTPFDKVCSKNPIDCCYDHPIVDCVDEEKEEKQGAHIAVSHGITYAHIGEVGVWHTSNASKERVRVIEDATGRQIERERGERQKASMKFDACGRKRFD
jgi:hypothetical protein